ncbi:MAG: hypothetical protein R2682_02000 [Pyrinomonadaceae bacterium]
MRLDSTQLWLSKTLEASFNTPEPTGSNYSYLGSQNPLLVLPVQEKVSDANRVGVNAPTHLCPTYWSHPELSVNDDAETDNPARIFRRALGGAVTDTVVTAGTVWDHTFAILSPQVGDTLPSFSMASLLGSASYLLAGCMVDRFKISQKNSDRVQYEADIVGSGKFTNPHGLTSLPAFVSPPCMDGFRTKISYLDSDGSTTIDLGTLGKVIEWSVEHKNNIRRNRRRVGDTIQAPVTDSDAAHVRSMPRGKYETGVQMMVDFADLADWQRSIKNAIMTNLKFTVVGPIISGADRHEFEIIVPKFSFESTTPGEDEGDAATTLNIVPLADPVTGGTITGRIRNGSATLV